MWSDQAYYYSDSSFQLELNLQFVRRTLIQALDNFEAEDCTRCRYIKCRCDQTLIIPIFGQFLLELAPGQSLARPVGLGVPSQPLTRPTTGQSLSETTPGQSLSGLTPGQSQSGPTHSQSWTGPTPGQCLPNSGQVTDALKSPPAIDLPRPEFKTSIKTANPPPRDVELWVRASTPNPDKTDSPGSKPYQVNFSWPPAPKSLWNDYKDKINKPEINTATVSQAGNVEDFFKSFSANMFCVAAKYAHAQKTLMQKLKFMAGETLEYTHF